MPTHNPGPSGTGKFSVDLTAADLDAARAELEPFGVRFHHSYVCGVLKVVAEDVLRGRVDEFTAQAARHGLALLEASKARPTEPSDVA